LKASKLSALYPGESIRELDVIERRDAIRSWMKEKEASAVRRARSSSKFERRGGRLRKKPSGVRRSVRDMLVHEALMWFC
jgi:hypothetical protein